MDLAGVSYDMTIWRLVLRALGPQIRNGSWICILLLSMASSKAGNLASDTGSDSETIKAALKTAAEHQIAVVDARLAVDEKGGAIKDDPSGLGPLVVPSPAIPSLDGLNTVAEQSKLIVVYVHGFNTPPLDAIKAAVTLSTMIKQENNLRPVEANVFPNASLGFVTFLWRGYFTLLGRGDLGRVRFTTAQLSASVSGQLFASFISSLRSAHPHTKILVIAHSLGAQVAMEGLKNLCIQDDSQAVFDSLILLQGAIRATSLYDWDYDARIYDSYLGLDDNGDISPIVKDRSYSRHEKGEYAESLRCTKQLIYTCAKKDEVLSQMFQWHEVMDYRPYTPGFTMSLPSDIYKEIKSMYVAVGSCYDESDKSEFWQHDRKPLGRAEDVFRTPGSRLPGGLLFPQNIYRNDTRRLSPSLETYREEMMLRYFNWRIAHVNKIRIDISIGAREDLYWHSPLQDERGMYIVEKFWPLVVSAMNP